MEACSHLEEHLHLLSIWGVPAWGSDMGTRPPGVCIPKPLGLGRRKQGDRPVLGAASKRGWRTALILGSDSEAHRPPGAQVLASTQLVGLVL